VINDYSNHIKNFSCSLIRILQICCMVAYILRSTARLCGTILVLRSESPSGKCAKLHTVAASNNSDHPTRSLSSSPSARTVNCSPGSQALLQVTPSGSLYYCLFMPHTYGCFSSRTSRSWWIAYSTQRQLRCCNIAIRTLSIVTHIGL